MIVTTVGNFIDNIIYYLEVAKSEKVEIVLPDKTELCLTVKNKDSNDRNDW